MAHSMCDWMGQKLIECNYGASSSNTLDILSIVSIVMGIKRNLQTQLSSYSREEEQRKFMDLKVTNQDRGMYQGKSRYALLYQTWSKWSPC